MNRFFKTALAGAAVTAILFTAGCNDGKKKEEAVKDTKPAAAQKKDKKAEEPKKAVVKPVPKSDLYEYASFLNDVEKVPPMTDEIIAEFEKHAKEVTLAPKDKKLGTHGKFIFNSTQSKGASTYIYRFTGELPGHHASEITVDGKKVSEQHYYHIDMTASAQTGKMTWVQVQRYDLTAENPKGVSTTIYEKTFR